jgi:hypothetical protein
MNQIEIKAVELVRHIRDQHYALLKNKSLEEVKAFFRQEATAANAEAKSLLREQTANYDHLCDQPKDGAQRASSPLAT